METIDRLDTLQALLRAALQVTAAKRQDFPPGWRTRDEVIVTHRFLIILKGTMDYTIEGRTQRLEAGTQFFVPAWSRREWVVPRSGGACRLLWCEFSSGPVALAPVLCWRKLRSRSDEVVALERVRVLADADKERATALIQEGELKSCLARFWSAAQTERVATERLRAAHPEVARAITWLEQHFAEPHALDSFYRTVTLSPNHFRLLFKRQTGETVQAMLARLRLRRARYLVQETALRLKEIAVETGFDDALYFSGQYKKFWGRTATEDRRAGGMA